MEFQVISFEMVASEVFQIIRSFDYTAKMYDDEGNQVYEPEEARRFFIMPENMLLSLVDDGDDSSLRLYIGKSTDPSDIEGFTETLRITATKYNLSWSYNEKDTDLKPSDFATRASVTEHREAQMNIFEGMYGTSRSSYLKLENARMIVRHSKKINENTIGGRGRNIEGIFIENAQGERMLFPTRQLLPARAELQHVNQGGNFNDAISQQIMRMANDFSNLSFASAEIATAAPMLGESAMSIREACRSKMSEMKKCFERLSRPFGYKMESQRMNETILTENEDQSLDISPLKEILTCEGFELSESVLKSIAEAVKSVAESMSYGEVEESLGDYKPKNVRGLYNFTHFEHPNGSFIQIHGGKRFKAIHQDTSGNQHEFDNIDDLKKHINEDDEDYFDDETSVEKTRKGPEQVSVFGKLVDKSAWDDLVAKKLELNKEPDVSIMPRFTSDDARKSFMLSKIIPNIKNDSMLNFLSYVSDMLENPRLSPEVRKNMNTIINVAIKSARVLDESEDILVDNEVIREFDQWMEQFDVSNVLSEDDAEPEIEYMRHVYTSPRMNASSEAAKNAILNRITQQNLALLSKYGPVKVMAAVDDEASYLDDLEEIGSSDISAWVNNITKSLERGGYDHLQEEEVDEDFLSETNEEENSEDGSEISDFDVDDFFNEYSDEFSWEDGQFNVDALSDEDRSFETSYVKSLIKKYLETHDEDDSDDAVDAIWEKDIEPKLSDAGYTLNEFAMGDNTITFSHTDLVIPTNQGEDLEREVTKPSSTDPYTGQEVPVDDDYIERMRTLAGMPWNR